MGFNQVFQRKEIKYLLDEEKYQLLEAAIAPYFQMDQYGKHTICNIYYDTEQDDLIRASLEKPVYKEKFRLRSYGVPGSEATVFLEIKKKYKGIVYKRREGLKLQEAEAFLNERIYPQKDTQILREIDYLFRYYKPEPKLFLAYDRMAYFGKQDPELRMTFDTGIRFRRDRLALAAGDEGEKLLEDSSHLLEIKVPDAFPVWLSEVLSELEIFPVSFSKYGTVYRNEQIASQRQEARQGQARQEAYGFRAQPGHEAAQRAAYAG